MDNFINNEEIKYFLKYKPQTQVVFKRIQKEKKDEITQLENEVSKMNIDIDVDPANPSSSSTNNNNNNNNTVESTLNNTTEPNKNIPTSNVLIELENTLNNF